MSRDMGALFNPPNAIVRRAATLTLLALALGAPLLRAQDEEGPINPNPPAGVSVPDIIRRFASKEKEFKEARDNYTYRQSTKVQTLDGDTVSGEYQLVFDVNYDSRGRRLENVVYAPQSTLEQGGISMSREDFEDIRNTLPFVLTIDELGDYNITYVGQQHVDELDTYVFDVAPKQILKDRRYFDGRIWVETRDLQIVKASGKSVPETRTKKEENLFPRFTTWREQIDGKYWFPTYTRADDVLHFSGGKNQFARDVHIRIIVKYTNYRRFGSSSRITYEGEEVKKGTDKPAGEAPQPQSPPPPK
ncbi:MAG TPA: hypothetical protein VFA60_02040 [Terriglobales bacterium]|nr:hypothetical protein [Terriglobales bacterium]